MSHDVPHRVGGWLPRDHRVLHSWLETKIDHVDANPRPLAPVIQEFQQLIETDAELYMAFHQMFEQVPQKPPYIDDPTKEHKQVRDYKHMLALFNHILTEAPHYDKPAANIGHILPINAILDWPMGTPAGLQVFCDKRVNQQFKKMFDVWADFLKSPESCKVLNVDEKGWFGVNAQQAMPGFAETFQCDSSLPHWGFKSWDNFFTREIRDGARPVISPEDDDVINSACESTVYRMAHGIKALDTFWIKEQPYSLNTMLNYDTLASQFVGGTVYQAFLSATDYHRWHSPVNGKVVKTVLVPGTYYAESPAMGFPHPDKTAQNNSQSFITSMAARALIFIEADNPKIGLMCFMAVGMAEVSTCEIAVREGDRVKKGQQTGMFHFGGSTHCLLFRPETKVEFTVKTGDSVHLNSAIAKIS